MSQTPQVITLGTAGGPRVWTFDDNSEPRCGIATAVVVGDKWYLVDCGQSVYRQIRKSGLDLNKLAGIFITHLHSDHVIDLANILTLSFYDMKMKDRVIPIYGPGNRQVLPPLSPRASGPVEPLNPENPVPGIAEIVDLLFRANATDINDRIIDSLYPNPAHTFQARDIQIPAEVGFHANDNASPAMRPFTIYEDDTVKVSATLVVHPPIAPAFAFRFDYQGGSVTISGDTRYSENLGVLAENTDLLLHEAIDFDWVYRVKDPSNETDRASIDHHKKSHTPPDDAGKLAEETGAKRLALHHLVPGNARGLTWQAASSTYSGELIIPSDNNRIELG